MSADNVTPLQYPSVDAPGLLDHRQLEDLARRCVVECRSGLSSRLPGGLLGMSCSHTIVTDPDECNQQAETIDFAVPLDAGRAVLRLPASLARRIVASCLGYEEATDEPLNSADCEVLQAALLPPVTWLEQLLQPRGGLTLQGQTDKAAWEPEGRAVLLEITLDLHGVRDTMSLAVPWPIIRKPLRVQGELRRNRTISIDALKHVRFRADAVIDGGTMELKAGCRLQPGDVVAVDEQPESDLKLMVGQTPVGRGKLGSRQSSWAIRITDAAGVSETNERGEQADD